ncbi:MAG: hypothetical protein AAB215_05010 [Planctomycetota bacterium]
MTDTAATPLDVDAILAEVRERIRRKRESGMYGPEVEAALRLPLPGGRPIFTEELGDPVPALADALDEPVEYDPRSRKPIVGAFITLARRVVMGLVRWWITDIDERRDRIDRLLARAVADLRQRPSPEFSDRLSRLEILKNGDVVASLPAKGYEDVLEWEDKTPLAAETFYHARVEQEDGERAWASPIWFAPE